MQTKSTSVLVRSRSPPAVGSIPFPTLYNFRAIPLQLRIPAVIHSPVFSPHQLPPYQPAKKTTTGVPAHMSVISARCPYLVGHIEAARKSSSASTAAATKEIREEDANGDGGSDAVSKKVVLCLEHASAETVALLVRYLYADELPSDATSGKTLEALARLANELLLPRLALFRC